MSRQLLLKTKAKGRLGLSLLSTVANCPGPCGTLVSALSVFHSKSVFYGVLYGRGGRLKAKKRRLPARAVAGNPAAGWSLLVLFGQLVRRPATVLSLQILGV